MYNSVKNVRSLIVFVIISAMLCFFLMASARLMKYNYTEKPYLGKRSIVSYPSVAIDMTWDAGITDYRNRVNR